MTSGIVVHSNNIGADGSYGAKGLAVQCLCCGRTEVKRVYGGKAGTVRWRDECVEALG